MRLKVNAGYIMVKPCVKDYGKLVTPYDDREMCVGAVVDVGTVRNRKGEVYRPAFAPGEKVFYEPFTGYEYNELVFVPYEFVYGVVKDA